VFGLISVIKALLDWLPLVENGKLLSLLQFKPLKGGGVQGQSRLATPLRKAIWDNWPPTAQREILICI